MSTVRLRALKDYSTAREGVIYPSGRVVEVSQEQARWLMDDAPGCFEIVEAEAAPKTVALSMAPVDKMVKRPVRSK
jgi:hypothetical protein